MFFDVIIAGYFAKLTQFCFIYYMVALRGVDIILDNRDDILK